MTSLNRAKLPTDVIFDGSNYYALEYPYTDAPQIIEKTDEILQFMDEYQREISAIKYRTDDAGQACIVIGGGSPTNGGMGFLLGYDSSGEYLWYVTMDEGNPVCDISVGDEIKASTSSGYQISVADLLKGTVKIQIVRSKLP